MTASDGGNEIVEIGGYPIKRRQERETNKRSNISKDVADTERGNDKEDDILPQEAEECRYICNWTYLDHTADIRVLSSGATFEDALISLGLAMYNYMTPIVDVQPKVRRRITASAETIDILIFHYLDELLFLYGSEYFIGSRIGIMKLARRSSEDGEGAYQLPIDPHADSPFVLEAMILGEQFDGQRHSQGTEVKAITMHDMRIQSSGGTINLEVLLDI